MKRVDVIIIGAGAAGLFCAIEAGCRGRRVLVLDSANKAGKKILMSGGGRCNFTNLDIDPRYFLSVNAHFCKSALGRFGSDDFIQLVKRHKIPFHEKSHGQLFCDHKGGAILTMLLSCCEEAKVSIQLNTVVNHVKQEGRGFVLILNTGERLSCQSLVIATGGLSIPTLGASPYGYQLAAQFGLPILPTRPGLVPFTLHPEDKTRFSRLSGVSVASEVSCNQQTFALDLLFTHRGLSGPAILQISSYWMPGDVLTINLDPNNTSLQDIPTLKQEKSRLSHCFSSTLPKRVIQTMLTEDMMDAKLQNLSTKKVQDLINMLQQWQIKPNATEGYRTAEVTLGGVDTRSLSSKTMEVKSVPGLYFIGEVLDVTGWLGGYNFQWAWSSGWAAGQVV